MGIEADNPGNGYPGTRLSKSRFNLPFDRLFLTTNCVTLDNFRGIVIKTSGSNGQS